MDEKSCFAVLTGDLVGSSGLKPGGAGSAEAGLRRSEQLILEEFGSVIHQRVDIFRGDGWQMVLLDPAAALRVGLLFRCLLLSGAPAWPIDTRLGMGFGRIEYLPEQDISAGMGEAFTLSGAGLDRCQKPVRMCLEFPDWVDPALADGLDLLIRLVDFQIQSWTRSQAEAVAGSLRGLTQVEIGRGWQSGVISQQAVSQHLDAAGWRLISDCLEYFDAVLPGICSRP